MKLKVPLGKFPVGSEFSLAEVDPERSQLTLYVDDGPMVDGRGDIKEVFRGKLVLSVVELPLITADYR